MKFVARLIVIDKVAAVGRTLVLEIRTCRTLVAPLYSIQLYLFAPSAKFTGDETTFVVPCNAPFISNAIWLLPPTSPLS